MAKDKETAMSSSSKRDKQEKKAKKKESREMTPAAVASSSASRKSSTDGVAKPGSVSDGGKMKKGKDKEKRKEKKEKEKKEKKSKRKEDAETKVLKELEENDDDNDDNDERMEEEEINGLPKENKNKNENKNEDSDDEEEEDSESSEEDPMDTTGNSKNVDTVIRSKDANEAGKRKNENVNNSSSDDGDDNDNSDGEMVKKQKQSNGTGAKIGKQAVIASLVPFANPLADERMTKKVLKNVRKGEYFYFPAFYGLSKVIIQRVSSCNLESLTNHQFKPVVQHSALKRGVKEVVKALRKSLQPSPSSSSSTATNVNPSSTSNSSTAILPRPKLTHAPAPAIVILAADISPMDVISHIPVLCEDMHVPYLYVRSRAELGLASATKRPTSVVMAMRQAGKSKKDKKKDSDKEKDKDDGTAEEDYKDVFEELLRIVQKAGRGVVI